MPRRKTNNDALPHPINLPGADDAGFSTASVTLKEATLYGKANSPLAIAAIHRAKADAQASEALSGYPPQITGTGQLDDNLKRQNHDPARRNLHQR